MMMSYSEQSNKLDYATFQPYTNIQSKKKKEFFSGIIV